MIYPGQTIRITYAQSNTSGWTYKVNPSDTLFLLSRRFGVSIAALKAANNLQSDYLWVGQALKIPSASGSSGGSTNLVHTIKSGDTLYLLAQKYGVTVRELQTANNLTNTYLYPGQKLVVPVKSNSAPASPSFNLSSSDMDLFAKLVTAEAVGEPYVGQVAVAATILNRLKSSRYPNTIPEIVYQVVNGRYQYSPVLDGRINLPASPTAYKAIKDALNGWDPSKGATGFYNPAKTSNQWVRSQTVSTVIGNHTFFIY